ncbi:hypothetical protein [Leptospira weilii]|uniref:hypothetical protein n=1 Tax=Leptospira weilii TaxID=28184 RepID=UPI000B0CBC28|nr:hypothetical protein [Leptospira weilii]
MDIVEHFVFGIDTTSFGFLLQLLVYESDRFGNSEPKELFSNLIPQKSPSAFDFQNLFKPFHRTEGMKS